jgi:predicted Rdx family selenoprotein
MKATITITVDKLEDWDEFKDKTFPEMEQDLTEHVKEHLDPYLGYADIKVEIEGV